MSRFRQYPLIWLNTCLAVPYLLFISTSAVAAERISARAESRLTIAWEYDDNVLEERSDKLSGGAGAVSLFSKVRLNYPQSLTLLNFHLGYIDHHKLAEEDKLTAGDILVLKLATDSERRIAGGWTAGAGAELKVRNIYRKNELNLLSEEGYVRGAGRLFTRKQVGDLGRLSFAYRYSFFNFETFKTFNYRAHSPSIRLSRPLAPHLAGSVQYSFTHRRYRRLINVRSPDEILVQLNERQRDSLHQLDFTMSYTRRRLVNFTWSLQRNDSNNYGFSYWNNRFSLLFAEKLPLDFFLNAYLFFELKRYSDEVDVPILIDIITEENDNNGAIVKLSRPLNETLEAALTVSVYRNESSIRELNFRKSLLNFALTCRF